MTINTPVRTSSPPTLQDFDIDRPRTFGRRVLDAVNTPTGTIGIALIIVVAIGLSWEGGSFASSDNLANVGSFLAIPLIIATFSSVALLAGVVDLSVGSMVGFAAALFVQFVNKGYSPWIAGLITLLCAVIAGSINGLAIVGFGAEPVAATLGMLTALRGLCQVIVGPTGLSSALVLGLLEFTSKAYGPLPLLFLLGLGLVAVASVLVGYTRVGRHIRAAGGDARAAGRAGIGALRIRFFALILSAFGAGLGGILYAGQLGGASNVLGTGLEFQVYAALMIGGYSILRGGIGAPIGGLFGLLVVAGVQNIFDVNAINPYYLNVVIGVLLLLTVYGDRLRGGDRYE
ncbi:ribose transport system permease protein [Nakamurella panacisegetis]|uniref:Autoinducer 2 import system permease protein LsrC n=1 Tax=Nakamurella panacisegetis TaxID=1090615 RepID=A0A1H0LH07_9ACTN|nr:ABC transporter permease [Nakamurella panacisegetis]SDO67365.1 ribose transport system permease protein [Nakamurella panacisegetis]